MEFVLHIRVLVLIQEVLLVDRKRLQRIDVTAFVLFHPVVKLICAAKESGLL